MPLRLIRNDITLVEADAIVNTANPAPVVGSGTDFAIHTAAGPELLEARRKIGPIAPGCCAATPAFALPARWVLHAVSPPWTGGTRGEAKTLRRTYDAALALASELGCESIAFPLMAAGSYGFPKDLALSIAIGAFTDFLLEHEMTIDLVLFNGNAFDLAGSLFSDLKSYIDDHYVAEQDRLEYPSAQLDRRRLERTSRKESKAVAQEDSVVGTALFAPPMAASAVADAAARDDLAALLRQRGRTFSECLMDFLRERDGKDSEVYKRAEVSKQLFSKILSNRDYQPTKSTAIQLALGLQLDLNRTQKLLESAGYALTRSSKADLVVQYFIERGIYSVSFINEALSDCGLPLLKTGLKS